MGRLTSILGIVCRNCDAYNDPGVTVCASCGQSLVRSPPPAGPSYQPPEPAPAPVEPPDSSRVTDPFFHAPGPAAAAEPLGDAEPLPVATDELPEPIPLVPSPVPPAAPAPIPLRARCPHCGADAGPGRFCAACGQPVSSTGTLLMAKAQLDPTALPVSAGKARLVLERGEGFEGASFRLNATEVQAGRSRGLVLFPNDPCLAQHHATFFYRDGALFLRDEGAPGGTFLRLRGLSVPLRAGDAFALGDRLFRYAGLLAPAPSGPPDGSVRVGAPRPPPAAVIEEWLEGGELGRVFVRPGPSVTFGRSGCAVSFPEDAFLSQRHAEIVLDAVTGAAKLKDLGSANGTFLRLAPRQERELADGDALRMGREVLRVEIGA